MNRKKFETPEAEIIILSTKDVLTYSGDFDGKEDGFGSGAGSGGSIETPVLPNRNIYSKYSHYPNY